eukprot:2052932-Pleurochrysis_carterae.AAC.3
MNAWMKWTFHFITCILCVAMQHDVMDSDSGSSCGYYDALIVLPSQFHKPLDRTELAMLAPASNDECDECDLPPDQQPALTAASSHQPNVPSAVSQPAKVGRG